MEKSIFDKRQQQWDGLEYNQLKKTVEKQLESEWETLQKTTENTEDGDKLANALLKLKELPSDARFTLECLLCGDKDSFLQNFKFVLDPGEWMRFPAAMDSIISEADWCINDDGYLRIARLEIEDEFYTEVNKRHGKTIKDPKAVRWFLFSNCWTDRKKIVQDWFFKKNMRQGFVKPILKSVKIAWFKSVGQFAEFIELAARPSNWDGFDFSAVKELDSLIEFVQVEEEV